MRDYAFEHLPSGYELYEIVDLSGRETADTARDEAGSGANLDL